jgi:hypothetical protein
MEVSGQLHSTATLPPVKQPHLPLVKEVGWAPDLVWTFWGKEKSLVPARNRTPAVHPLASRYTELRQLQADCMPVHIHALCLRGVQGQRYMFHKSNVNTGGGK